ncbi:hypothetical protein A2223_03180 [Candidatus Falkowbacteria bacterium RIFOXYA2_FULL_35_8]|uniref:Uncharacterized protein n=1 Tax=Candidatus Falkowbacteria bacterium RIFOXYC2_FULL_36_12 TaxID=1798002 RepID=A0A1F5SY69_9BACT|nr:MAG: hypothetical protein A2478_04215 [Candidatus Falkowbacteria bacterium RIFOXYC2_FULL_36_12]OGF34038.1 MAG: hypothetical protein A2223_03180 [Candidatus Falkowbacteria bacterium RIFOXYA2_FULL_35_8]
MWVRGPELEAPLPIRVLERAEGELVAPLVMDEELEHLGLGVGGDLGHDGLRVEGVLPPLYQVDPGEVAFLAVAELELDRDEVLVLDLGRGADVHLGQPAEQDHLREAREHLQHLELECVQSPF